MSTSNQGLESLPEPHDDNTTSHAESKRNRKSVQEVSKQAANLAKKAKWPKSDARHWQGRLFKNSFTRNGARSETADWCVKIKHQGQRETFNLATPNAEAAAIVALRIFRTVKGAGWDAALTEHKPEAAPKQPKPATLGEWMNAVKQTAELRPATFTNYSQCLRQIAAEIEYDHERSQLMIAAKKCPSQPRPRQTALICVSLLRPRRRSCKCIRRTWR